MRQKKKSKGVCCWSMLALVVLAIVAVILLVVMVKTDEGSGSPGAPVKKYADALKLAMQFFDVQKCKISLFLFFSIPF